MSTLTRWFAHKDEYPLGPESYGLPHPLPQDPHEVEGRKWFRRALIALCIAGYIMLLMPQELRDRLNGDALPLPTQGMNGRELQTIREVCEELSLTGMGKRTVTYHDCRKEFSDGTWYHTQGY